MFIVHIVEQKQLKSKSDGYCIKVNQNISANLKIAECAKWIKKRKVFGGEKFKRRSFVRAKTKKKRREFRRFS